MHVRRHASVFARQHLAFSLCAHEANTYRLGPGAPGVTGPPFVSRCRPGDRGSAGRLSALRERGLPHQRLHDVAADHTIGANASVSQETTQNAGATWHTVPGQGSNAPCLGAWGRDVFANAVDGVAGRSLAAGAFGDSFLCRTRNGGATWTTMTVAAPPTLSPAATAYALPAFFGTSSGILPVAYLRESSATVAFYGTQDAGATWSLESTVSVAGTLKSPPAFSVQGDVGTFPSVAFAGPQIWWVMGDGGAGPPTLAVTADGGRTWTNVTATGLPPSPALDSS